jgi:hypothetical protein
MGSAGVAGAGVIGAAVVGLCEIIHGIAEAKRDRPSDPPVVGIGNGCTSMSEWGLSERGDDPFALGGGAELRACKWDRRSRVANQWRFRE